MESDVVQHEGATHATPNYYLIWLVLFVLTLAEVGVAFI